MLDKRNAAVDGCGAVHGQERRRGAGEPQGGCVGEVEDDRPVFRLRVEAIRGGVPEAEPLAADVAHQSLIRDEDANLLRRSAYLRKGGHAAQLSGGGMPDDSAAGTKIQCVSWRSMCHPPSCTNV